MAKVSKQTLEPPAKPETDTATATGATVRIGIERITAHEVESLPREATVEIGLDSEIYPASELTFARLEDILRHHVSTAGDCRTTFVVFQLMEDRAEQLELQLKQLLNDVYHAGLMSHCKGITFHTIWIAASLLSETSRRLDAVVGRGALNDADLEDMAELWRERAAE